MKASGFDYFVVLAGMRTGSNLLEERISAMPGIRSHGELFNPHFFGKPKSKEQFGLSMSARDSDPIAVIDAMKRDGADLPGFRLFYDHDPRVIDHVLNDPSAAKIVLTRRPVESYVSLKIARKTGQWWLGDMTAARSAKVAFDAVEYAEFLNTLAAYQARIRSALQTTGQTAFHIDYADLTNPEVIAGLGRYLGADGPPAGGKVRAKVQNPIPVSDRLTNAVEAARALETLEAPDLGFLASYEPDRGPGLRMFHACESAPLLYMPIRGVGGDPVPAWMRAVDPNGKVESGMTQKDVRKWMRTHPGHRSFTLLRHPLPRAYDAFCQLVLPAGVDGYADIRSALFERYEVPLPDGGPGDDWSLEQQREAFLGFLTFVKGNLGGQTSLRVDYSWASQEAFLSAIAGFAVPDRVLREQRLKQEAAELCSAVGIDTAPLLESGSRAEALFSLAKVMTPEIEAAAARAYRRDYIFFGFDAWKSVA